MSSRERLWYGQMWLPASTSTAEIELREGESVQVTPQGIVVRYSGTQSQTAVNATNFVRRIPKRILKTLNLVDIVAGGDGFGTARDRGIDPPPERPPPHNQTQRTSRRLGMAVTIESKGCRLSTECLFPAVARGLCSLTRRAILSPPFRELTTIRGVAFGPAECGRPTVRLLPVSFPLVCRTLIIRRPGTRCWVCSPTRGSRRPGGYSPHASPIRDQAVRGYCRQHVSA